MGAEKKLQKLLDKANKGTGNTTEATDGRGEISDALVDSGKGRLVRKGKRLYDRMNKGSGIKMVSPLNFPGANSSNSSCWDGYRKDGVKDSPSGTGETVNNCVKIGSPAKMTDEEKRMHLEEMDGVENSNTRSQKAGKKMSYNNVYENDNSGKGAAINDPDGILNNITDKQYESGYKYRVEEDGSRTLEPGR